MLAIITGTIRPSIQMNQLTLRDENERLRQYEESIYFLLDSRAFSKIIFCENSGYGIEKLAHLLEIAQKKDIELELLSYQGNEKKACIHGKGYGEGEIMDYVFSHSKIAHTEPCFVKITGRLKVNNIEDIVTRIDKEKTYFNIPNRTRRDIYDTRIYGMPVSQFKTCFLNVYEQVMDEQGIFLETVYTGILQDNKIKVTNFPRYPRIVGISGSGGITYGYTEWKCRIRDVLSRLNFYRIK
ncbi:hypothetical protein [Parablautia intestinalis]|uniref:hypothetical protein n=1 Tax=Parablautia intestinalis TaxID=2320100 RepID=UPI00256EC7D2|nr:hypothetical protein [Parablautia intestinalis]